MDGSADAMGDGRGRDTMDEGGIDNSGLAGERRPNLLPMRCRV